MKMPLLLMLSLLFSYAPAQLIFQELFEVEPPDDRGILANVNGWSSSWNSADESLARLVETNLTWEAPFAARGRAIQIVNSRSTAFRELPEELNGQTVYFSFLFRFFQEEGGTGQLRFRSDAGHVIAVGFTDGQFHVQAQNERTNWGRVRDRENYFVVGRLIISEDGRSVDIEMSAYTQRAAIAMESTGCGWKSYTLASSRIRCRVSSFTEGWLRNTRLTVMWETPATSASSRIV